MYIIQSEKIEKNLKESYEHILSWPRLEYYKYKENAMRAYELCKQPWYTYSLAECPDIDIEFSDNKTRWVTQLLNPLW